MRVIVDTNVFVSGLISEVGPSARIVDAVLRGEIIPVMSPATFAELEEVLHRSELQRYFRRAGITVFQFLTVLTQVAQLVRPRASIGVAIRRKGFESQITWGSAIGRLDD